MGEAKPFHERRELVERCARVGFEAAFGQLPNGSAWGKQTQAFRQTFREQAKAILREAWGEVAP